MKTPCNVILDLIPLYHDKVCSQESRDLVDEHIKECRSCEKALDALKDEQTAAADFSYEAKPIKAISALWKKSKTKAFLKGGAITLLACALLIGAYVFLTQWKGLPVSADVLEVSELSQLSDGSIVFHLFVNDNKNLYFTKFTVTDDGRFYLTPMHSVIETKRAYDIGGFSQYHVFYPPGYDAEPTYPGITLPQNVKEIYVGPVGDGTLVWENGMELPEASSELEDYVR